MHGGERKDGTSGYLSISMPNTFSMSPEYVRRFVQTKELNRVKRNVFDILKEKTKSSNAATDHSQEQILNYLTFGSVQGTIHTIKTLNDKSYRFLYILQFALTNVLQHYGGCNPRQYRYYTPKSKFPVCMYSIGSNYHKITSEPFSNMLLDGQLLLRYYTLPLHTQIQLAHAIGNTRNGVYSLLNKLIFV